MIPKARKPTTAMTAAAVLVISAAVLPQMLTWLANLGIRRIPGIRGRVRRVRFNFIAPGLRVQGVSLTKLNGGVPLQRIEVDSIAVVSYWKALLAGAFVGSIGIRSPHVFLDFDRIDHTDGGRKSERREEANRQSWQEKVKRFPRFKVSSVVLTNGEIRLLGVPGEKEAEIAIDHLNLRVENITNSTDLH